MSSEHGPSLFVPNLLLALSLVGFMAFQATQLLNDRGELEQVKELQEKPLAEARTLRAQLQGVAEATASLARQGNPNAKLVMDQLAKAGITVKSPAEPAASE